MLKLSGELNLLAGDYLRVIINEFMEMPLDYYTVNVPPHQNPAKNLLEAIFQAANSYPWIPIPKKSYHGPLIYPTEKND